jgi:hypothetical protein
LIGLAAAGGFGLLRRLFGVLRVTASVRDEVLAGGDRPGARELQAGLGAGWIRVIENVPDLLTFPDLGDGEADTLRAALAAGPALMTGGRGRPPRRTESYMLAPWA